MIKYFFILFIIVRINSISVAQEVITIPWETPREIILNEEKIKIPVIQNQTYSNNKPFYYWEKDANSFNNIQLSSYTTIACASEEINYLKKEALTIPTTLDYKLKIITVQKTEKFTLQLFPFIQENGIIKKINTISLDFSNNKNAEKSLQKNYATNSVLASGSGTWYKIKISKSGIYKIDKSFLESCGINTSNLNPNNINIFGNGDGKLPELNSVPSTDDLAKNAIFISGDSDGQFNDNDYILFYGWGPTRWYPNSNLTSFNYDQNIYSDYSYYFININPSNTPLRINTINSTSGTITNNVNSYSYYTNHEVDTKSLMSGGQRWYGEEFDTELTKSFNFDIPSIVNATPVTFAISMATNSSSTSTSTHKYLINGSQVYSANLPSASTDSYSRANVAFQINANSSSIPLNIIVTRTNPSTLTYLDNILINTRRNLVQLGNQYNFRDLLSVGNSKVSEFTLSNFSSSGFVWDITNRHQPIDINGNYSNSTFVFRLETDSLREFVASDGLTFFTPEKVGNISYQNLHALSQVDYVIVSHPEFTSEANRLANLHRANGTTVHVVTTEQVYNEFSSGMLDPTAIKRFMKMFYDRSLLDPTSAPKYLLLFGDGTFDPKNRVANNNNYVPTYQAINSENHISALVSDDYFGLLDDSDSFDDADHVDIGVGRLLISSNQIATEQVNKIEHYMKNGSSLYSSSNCCNSSLSNNTFGDWRQKYVLISDDEQGGQFVSVDAEPNYNYVTSNHTDVNCDKLYLDAFTQVTNAGGQRYPDVFNAISDRVQNGALIINYIGHGGEVGVAEERVITIPQIQSWNNINKLNLLVSATCEFTKFDDPARVSAGEWASLNPTGSSIALMTTTRSIYISINTDIINKFYENVFKRDLNYQPQTFGEIIKNTKNQASPSENKRCFTLIGDPALKIALPTMKVVTDSINSLSPDIQIDTIKALSKVTIKGHLTDMNNNIISNFNGVLSPTIFDKPKALTTLGQDVNSPIIPFDLQKNAIFKGQVSVKNGYFSFTFVTPKDINYSYGNGKISYYANTTDLTSNYDAGGDDQRLIIGGIDPNGVIDNQAPTIKMYLNEEKFADGGITNETPTLFAKIEDDNGINTVGNGIGHDITAILDNETANPIILNNYYTADLDSYQKGQITYTFPPIAAGEHKLTLKAWDINNNSVESTIHFTVKEQENIALDHVLNYPNPFTTKTSFFFEHNQVCSELDAQVQIFTISGKVVKTINQTVNTIGFRSNAIDWDGKDDFGDQLAKGVYIYRLIVKSSTGEIAEKTEKLVLLK
ncbi:MAG: type IX secretion system sortase PorU [Fluviicola sp.]|nr:type IX secretion system sortase PorU [Fluviicola sp.]